MTAIPPTLSPASRSYATTNSSPTTLTLVAGQSVPDWGHNLNWPRNLGGRQAYLGGVKTPPPSHHVTPPAQKTTRLVPGVRDSPPGCRICVVSYTLIPTHLGRLWSMAMAKSPPPLVLSVPTCIHRAVVPKWLRGWTRNPL